MIKAAYIHIPFCEHICHYCDFNKVFLKGQPVDEYLDALEKEMKLTLSLSPSNELKSIFVGGGTPTALNVHQLERQGADIQTKVEELEQLNQSMRDRDKIKDDAISHLSDQLVAITARLQELENLSENSCSSVSDPSTSIMQHCNMTIERVVYQ